MKKGFSILKHKPMMEITLTRDSVCAGDDADAPHEETITQPSFTEPIAFINNISTRYLPSVAGVGHSWDCILNGELIGTVFVDNIISKVREVQYAENNSVHFRYHSAPF